MSLWHCSECHHEWPGREKKCDWCGGEPVLIARELPEDKFWRGGWRQLLEEVKKKWKEKE